MPLSRNNANMLTEAPAHGMQPTGRETRRLWQAAVRGHLDEAMVRGRCFDPNLVVDGIPLLVAVAENGHVAVVKLLLGHDAVDPNVAMADGTTSLLLAAQNGHAAVVAALLAHRRIDPNRAAALHGITPLFSAVQNGHGGIVEALLAHEAIEPGLEVDGMAPCIAALEYGYEAIAERILAHPKIAADIASVLREEARQRETGLRLIT